MDQNRQKVMIGALAVVALGAIAYYGFIRESSGPAREQVDTSQIVRRERAASPQEKDSGRRERTASNRTRSAPEEIERRERDLPPDREPLSRRGRRRATEKLEKEKKVVPAS